MNVLNQMRSSGPSSVAGSGHVAMVAVNTALPVHNGGPSVKPATRQVVTQLDALRAWYSTKHVGVVGASGTQGKAYTLAALETAKMWGHDVYAVVRDQQAYRHGAVVRTNTGPDAVPVRLTDDPKLGVVGSAAEVPLEETVFINSVSASGVGKTLDQMPRGARVLTTQNGVDLGEGNRHGLDVQPAISVITSSPDPVTGGAFVKPGGKLQVGADNPFLADVLQAFDKQGLFSLEVVDDINATKWDKIALNSALNAPATLFGQRLGGFLELMKSDPRFEKLITGLVNEVRQVALAQGVRVGPADRIMGNITDAMKKFPEHPTSMQSTFLRGGETELPVLNEGVARLSRDAQLPTPLNDLVVSKMKLYEELRSKHGAGDDFHSVHADIVRATCEELLEAAQHLQ